MNMKIRQTKTALIFDAIILPIMIPVGILWLGPRQFWVQLKFFFNNYKSFWRQSSWI